jgi:hypothetical protein
MTPEEIEHAKDLILLGKEIVELRTENTQLKQRVRYLEKQNLELIKIGKLRDNDEM